MIFSEESLEKLRKILENDGHSVSEEELLDLAINLFSVVEITYRPIKKEWLEKIKK